MLERTASPSLAFKAFACFGLVFTLSQGAPARLLAQDTDSPPQQGASDYEGERRRAFELCDQSKFTEALPILEKLAARNPSDREVLFFLGFTTLATSKSLKDAGARKQARIRARGHLERAGELGFKHPLLQTMLQTLPPDGGKDEVFSQNKEADDAMRDGETAFVRGDFDGALAFYERALAADPKLYEAALFAGDMLYKKGQHERAGVWFGRAIAINPDRETAYRYWANSLLTQGKGSEARDKYVEAIISEPYNRLTWGNFERWAKMNNIQLGHPRIEPPTSVKAEGENKVTITLDSLALDKSKKDDGSSAWMVYGLSRALWAGEKFRKEYPAEKTYRHSLREEAEALGMVAKSVKEQMKDKKIGTLDPMLGNLVKLYDAGLIEAFILLARPDEGIAQDYAAYRRANRAKLRQYIIEVVASR